MPDTHCTNDSIRPANTIGRRAVLGAAALALVALAPAGEARERPQPTGENHYFGKLGPALAPDYEGSDHYEVYPLAILGWIRDGMYARLEGDTLMTNVIPMSLFELGPAARWQRERDDVEDGRMDRMRDISGALEAGGLAGIWLRDPDAPLRQAGLRATVLQDVSGSHGGLEVKLNAMGGLPLGDKLSVVVNVSSRYASDDFMDTYFSVDADNARRSGLPQFRADGGFKDVGADLTLAYFFSDHWGVGFTASYTRLIGDAGDSPVVDIAGSRNQFVGAVTLNFQY
jgi:outer membrane protein